MLVQKLSLRDKLYIYQIDEYSNSQIAKMFDVSLYEVETIKSLHKNTGLTDKEYDLMFEEFESQNIQEPAIENKPKTSFSEHYKNRETFPNFPEKIYVNQASTTIFSNSFQKTQMYTSDSKFRSYLDELADFDDFCDNPYTNEKLAGYLGQTTDEINCRIKSLN